MNIDTTIKGILLEIQQEYKEEGIQVSIQELAEICASQFRAGTFAFKKGLEIRIPLFGTFIRKHGVEKSKEGAEFKKIQHIFDSETVKRKTLELQLKNKEETKKRAKIRRSKMGKVTFKSLQETKDVVKTVHRFDKILEKNEN